MRHTGCEKGGFYKGSIDEGTGTFSSWDTSKICSVGKFCVKVRDLSMNVYYNMDLGNSKTKVFDLSSGTYKNMETAHRSFHSSGHSHMKEKADGKKLFKGEICDGSPMNDPDKTPLILGVESFHFDVAPLGNAAYD